MTLQLFAALLTLAFITDVKINKTMLSHVVQNPVILLYPISRGGSFPSDVFLQLTNKCTCTDMLDDEGGQKRELHSDGCVKENYTPPLCITDAYIVSDHAK